MPSTVSNSSTLLTDSFCCIINLRKHITTWWFVCSISFGLFFVAVGTVFDPLHLSNEPFVAVGTYMICFYLPIAVVAVSAELARQSILRRKRPPGVASLHLKSMPIEGYESTTLQALLNELSEISRGKPPKYYKNRLRQLLLISLACALTAGVVLASVYWMLWRHSISESFLRNATFEWRLQILAHYLPVILILPIVYLARWLQRNFAKSPEEILKEDQRRHLLWLRSFGDDQQGIQLGSGLYSLFFRFEDLIVRCLRPFGPVIAVGRPGENLPETGAARYYFKDEEWQEKVKNEMLQSKLIAVFGNATQGLKWEVDQIRHLQLEDRAAFFVWADSGADLQEYLFTLSAQLDAPQERLPAYWMECRGLFGFRLVDGRLVGMGIGKGIKLDWLSMLRLVVYVSIYPIIRRSVDV